jgi:hypothetical protein
MKAFGKVCDADKLNLAPGPAWRMDEPSWINSYPVLDLNGFTQLTEVRMFQNGTLVTDGIGACWTQGATEGCIPVCAAEFGEKAAKKKKSGVGAAVDWIYLVHCHGNGRGVVGTELPISNPAKVFVVALHYAPKITLDGDSWVYQKEICETLDPKNQIPRDNTYILRGSDAPFSTLAISPTGLVGVLANAKTPVANVQHAADHAKPGCLKCFLSTAACRTMGQSDDCRELRALRWFRDHVLSLSEEGRGHICAYYAAAPRVVEHIETCPDRSVIYHQIYHRYLLPAVHAIETGNFSAAHDVLRTVLNDYCRPPRDRS